MHVTLSTVSRSPERSEGEGPGSRDGAIIRTILLGIVLFIGLGSAWSLLVDARRLRQADKHLIVITPEAFVKQEGDKIIYVPLVNVRHVTARGAPPPDRSLENARTDKEISGVGENVLGFL